MASLLKAMSFCSFAPKGATCDYQTARLSRASPYPTCSWGDPSQTVPTHFPHHAARKRAEHQTHGTHRVGTERSASVQEHKDTTENSYEVGQVNKSTGPTRCQHSQGPSRQLVGDKYLHPSLADTINTSPKVRKDFHIHHIWRSS